MKRLVYFIPVLAALIGGGACTPNDAESYMTVSPEEVSIDAAEQSFDLTIAANVTYRVNPQETWITISQKASNGEETVFSVAVEANEDAAERIGTINIIGDDVTPKKVTITQAGTGTGEGEGGDTPDPGPTYTYLGTGTLAQWDLYSDRTANGYKNEAGTFVDTETAPTPGNGGKYAPCTSSTLNATAKIEFYRGDMVLPNASDFTYEFTRGVGSGGDIYVQSALPGDYWLITVNAPEGSAIKSGSEITFDFNSRVGQYSTSKWVLEYSCDEGTNWTPIGTMKEETETWKKLLSETEEPYTSGSAQVSYNITIPFNYTVFQRVFTVNADATILLIRLRPVGNRTDARPDQVDAEQKVDIMNDSVQCRFSSRQNYDEAGNELTSPVSKGAMNTLTITSVPE